MDPHPVGWGIVAPNLQVEDPTHRLAGGIVSGPRSVDHRACFEAVNYQMDWPRWVYFTNKVF